ncbi:MAG: hypothetical protein K1X78_05070 [Verrucomicrobiaceae bacterium]|nr:hypothetical protein [Verrucomicrobiaceae bacterium]
MRHNRYRNSVKLTTVSAFIAVTLVVLFIALCRVADRNRIHALGDEQRQVEKEIGALRQELTQLDLRIESLLTRDKVQPRLAGARTMLRPISKDRLIELSP